MAAKLVVLSLAALLGAIAQPALAQRRPFGLSAVQGLGPAQGAGDYREWLGERFSFVCPASDGSAGAVFGTDVYTGESAVCAAAIHAAVLRPGQAGVVTLVIGNGADSFRGSSRNGVTTRNNGTSRYSYTFVRDSVPGTITWQTVWNGIPDDFSTPVVVLCPANGARNGTVWGTGDYARDSAICLAAVHNGAITVERGGLIEVRRARHSGEFTASTSNGVSSQRWGPFQDAFTVTAAARAGSQASATPTRQDVASPTVAVTIVGDSDLQALRQTAPTLAAEIERERQRATAPDAVRSTTNTAPPSPALAAEIERDLVRARAAGLIVESPAALSVSSAVATPGDGLVLSSLPGPTNVSFTCQAPTLQDRICQVTWERDRLAIGYTVAHRWRYCYRILASIGFPGYLICGDPGSADYEIGAVTSWGSPLVRATVVSFAVRAKYADGSSSQTVEAVNR